VIATATKEYKALLAETAPRPIHTESENEVAIQQLEKLTEKRSPSSAERQLIELLTVLIEAFEEKHYSFEKRATRIEIMQELMEANNLKQKDLVGVFGTPSIVSEVLHGKRGLTVEHIKKLSQRFKVSPVLFI
jgi:HTH-type transcriptional regulator / antitoxin HigA